MVVPSPFPSGEPAPRPGLSKETLRNAAIAARKAYVATLSDAQRARQEARLARRLTSLLAGSNVVAGYSALGSEISIAAAMEEARAVGTIIAFPTFDDPGRPFVFRAGEPCKSGPFGILQPAASAVKVEPDLVLVPLVAVDSRGTRLGRGKGHYDRALARLRRGGAKLVGVGWDQQRLGDDIPADDWDMPLDGFVSPGKLEWFR